MLSGRMLDLYAVNELAIYFFRENYLFVCLCEKCRLQSDEPDQSSSEEDDESDADNAMCLA